MSRNALVALIATATLACAPEPGGEGQVREPASVDTVLAVPNDNRLAAGHQRRNVRTVNLDARVARWRPDLDVDSTVTVQAFAERGGTPSVPGPLLRVREGTEVRLTVRNLVPDSTLVVHGLRAGTMNGADDTLTVAPGATRAVTFRATVPGTYLYWGTTTGREYGYRWGRDAQLTGAIVVDPRDAPREPNDRVLVVTLIDIYPDSVERFRQGETEDIWELAVNGLSWPHTERLSYQTGDTVRWRIVNGGDRSHPMHLHGFHFRTVAKGDGRSDTTYAPNAIRHAVTEFMLAGSTAQVEWVPTRAGNWLLHCHMTPHITPFPQRPDSVRAHDAHDLARHPIDGMAGLVVGITVTDPPTARRVADVPHGGRRLRLLAQEARGDAGKPRAQGYVLQRDAEPRRDSVEVPGTPLVVVRGETTGVTVVNRLSQPTSVHWHGIELESVYDGVAGWSGRPGSMAPMVVPGDSFTAWFAAPRAGTYIYHTHMDEEAQLASGMYGPLIVLEPGEAYDPATDLTFMYALSVQGGQNRPSVNGRLQPPPITVRAGVPLRLRLINILLAAPATITLRADSSRAASPRADSLEQWLPIAKDGADLPASLQRATDARVRLGVGETYDFRWTPGAAGEVTLIFQRTEDPPERAVRQRIVIVAPR